MMYAFWIVMKSAVVVGLLLIVGGVIWYASSDGLERLNGISLIFLSIPFLAVGGGAFLFKRARA